MTYREKIGAPRRDESETAPGIPMPCAYCGALTPHETLRTLGARCEPCYRHYCAEPRKWPDVGDKGSAGPKAWAHRLKAREEAGERLSLVQRNSWREALRAQTPESEADL